MHHGQTLSDLKAWPQGLVPMNEPMPGLFGNMPLIVVVPGSGLEPYERLCDWTIINSRFSLPFWQ